MKLHFTLWQINLLRLRISTLSCMVTKSDWILHMNIQHNISLHLCYHEHMMRRLLNGFIWCLHGSIQGCGKVFQVAQPDDVSFNKVIIIISRISSFCKSRGFHGSDYEECRLPRYINTLFTSQETHYVSTTEHSRLTLCKIWGFHGGDNEGRRLSRMLRHVALVRTDVSEELRASIIRVTRLDEQERYP
jgi:hypothetical protein